VGWVVSGDGAPDPGGGRKVEALRLALVWNADTSVPYPFAPALYADDPHPYPSPQGGGE
jgi:hypothetical protein